MSIHSMNALGGHQACLDAAPRAEPDDVVSSGAKGARHRERGNHMTAGAARHDQDRTRHVRPLSEATRPEASTSWLIRSITPIHASVTSMLERP